MKWIAWAGLGGVLCGVLPWPAAAAQASFAGRSIVLEVPRGFCEVGTTGADKTLFDEQRASTRAAGDLAQLAVPCDELRIYRGGKAIAFSQWLQVLVLRQKGAIRPLPMKRGAFVREMSKAAPKTFDTAGVERLLNERLAEMQSSLRDFQLHSVAASDDAFFAVGTMTIAFPTGGVREVVVCATTLVNQLPVGVYAYVVPARSKANASAALTNYLQLILDKNP